MKNNPLLKEQTNAEKNYQLNMEILSSLKPLPGKVFNLQSEKIIFKNEEINKKVIFPEEKYTTSSSISKGMFCDPFANDEKTQKKSLTSNSIFKPVAYYPIKKTTMNFYNIGTIMSFPDFLAPNPTSFNPLKITNSSFSKNSFYPVVNPENAFINPINQINPINNIATFNPISPFLPNFTQIQLLNEQICKKNDFNQTKNNFLLNKKRNPENENITFNLKENENKEKEYNDIKKTNNTKIFNIPKVKNTFFCVKPKKEEDNKKIMFTVITKSNYIYRKRKPRIKKLLNNIQNKISCGHDKCDGLFKTKKQLVFHHYKMSIECHNDTINLLKMINSVKEILLKKKNFKEKENIFNKFSELYKETMKNISLPEHIETLVGFNFEDEVNCID